MMEHKKILKYTIEINPGEVQRFKTLGTHYDIVSVIEQNGKIVFYVMHTDYEYTFVEPNEFITKIVIYGTGHEIPITNDLIFKATVKVGEYVWHVFVDNRLTE